MLNVHDVVPGVSGRLGLWRVRRDGHVTPITFTPNQIQYSWGMIAAQTLGNGLASYRVSSMYIEYENVASPGDPVTIPAFDRDEGIEYFDDLQVSGTKDFLRVPLIQAPLLGIASGFESYFTEGVDGNKLTFFTQSSGVAGVHGKTYSVGANSTVYGATLVATPVFADRTQDVIFARSYFDVADQTIKDASSQVGLTWEISFA